MLARLLSFSNVTQKVLVFFKVDHLQHFHISIFSRIFLLFYDILLYYRKTLENFKNTVTYYNSKALENRFKTVSMKY
jgi:hypothetical protein